MAAKDTKAEKWLERIDRPMKKGGFGAGINKQAVKRMQEAAVTFVES